MKKLYTDDDYFRKANEANAEGKKLVKIQEEREYEVEVLEWEKKIIQVPIYNEDGEIIGYEGKEVDDYDKPIIDPETGEQAHHTETRTEWVEYIEIQDNPENFERCFFETSLGFVRRKVYMQTGEYKDFLGDMVAGLQPGMKILTYTRNLEQNEVIVTNQFIQECIMQYQKDFGQKE